MKPFLPRAAELAAPKQQRNWDWRAAANFICGGTGGGLLLLVAFAGFDGIALRLGTFLGLALIGCGLTCVWFEIGRPWRALNVYRHFASSWMTREAVVALAVFASGGLVLLSGSTLLAVFSGFCGLAFLYSQARILAANKGIPAWRHPRSIPLMVATGLAEGAAIAVCVGAASGTPMGASLPVAFVILVAVRAWFWKIYRERLAADGAPEAALKVLQAFSPRFVALGNVAPLLLVATALEGLPGQSALLFVAGILAIAGGWMMKYTLVRRAAFTQGLAIQRIPTRGLGKPGPQAKPGWKPTQAAKAG